MLHRIITSILVGLVAALCVHHVPSHAAEIKGGFGITLGEKLPPGTVIVREFPGQDFVKVKPPKSSPLFNTYYVDRTPKTGLVYRIDARRNISTVGECTNDVRLIVAAMKGKYGKPTVRPWGYEASGDKTMFRDNAKGIAVYCHHNIMKGYYTLITSYTSVPLYDQAQKERLEMLQSGFDDSVL